MQRHLEEIPKVIASAFSAKPYKPALLAAKFEDNREVDSTMIEIYLFKPALFSALSELIEWVHERIPQCNENAFFQSCRKAEVVRNLSYATMVQSRTPL